MRARIFWISSLCFILINLLVLPVSGPNPRSRIAATLSVCDDLPKLPDFQINDYRHLTIDWAQSPEGNFYSNKAPAPILLAVPILCPLDALVVGVKGDFPTKLEQRERLLNFYEIILSFIWQMVGLVLVWYFVSTAFSHIPPVIYLTSCFSLYFGSTAALFMNSWFGHGLSAIFLLATCLSFAKQRYKSFGFFLGWALLSDYAIAFLFPALALLVVLQKLRPQNYFQVLVGAALPALFWIFYHQISFGGVFHLAQKYQNPLFVDLASQSQQLWGVVSFLPDIKVFMKLLFGSERGLAITQPWILASSYLFVKNFKKLDAQTKTVGLFTLCSLAALLSFNASFGQWHGGGSTGPRYLSPALPLFSFLILLMGPVFTRRESIAVHVLLVYSIIFYVCARAAGILAPQENLWFYIVSQAWERGGSFFLRAGIFTFALGIGLKSCINVLQADSKQRVFS